MLWGTGQTNSRHQNSKKNGRVSLHRFCMLFSNIIFLSVCNGRLSITINLDSQISSGLLLPFKCVHQSVFVLHNDKVSKNDTRSKFCLIFVVHF